MNSNQCWNQYQVGKPKESWSHWGTQCRQSWELRTPGEFDIWKSLWFCDFYLQEVYQTLIVKMWEKFPHASRRRREKEFFIKYSAVLSCSVVSDCDSTDCRLPGSSVHGIFQARILEWVAMPSSRGSSQLRDWTQVFCIAGRFFINWATREVLKYSRAVVKTPHSQCLDLGSIFGQGIRSHLLPLKIPHITIKIKDPMFHN